MRISREHRETAYFDELNRVAEGRLYSIIERMAKQPLPTNYAQFGEAQRLRTAQERIAEQFHWSRVPSERRLKPGSELGVRVLAYLEIVERDDDPQAALDMAESIKTRLGKVLFKAVEREVAQQQRMAAFEAKTQEGPGPVAPQAPSMSM